MTYAELQNLIERVALDTITSGHFHCGNDSSLNLAVEEKGYPVVHLDPVVGNRNIATGNKVAHITLGFFEQGVDLSTAEEQALYARQEQISAKLLFMLQEEEELGDISVRDTPVKNFTTQKLAGWACELELKLPMPLCF